VKRHNLHTHTNYSDGKLPPEQLIETAEKTSLEILGISEHAFTNKLPPGYQITNRLQQYLEHLKKIQSSSSKIDVRIGIEIDVSKCRGIAPSKLPFDVLNGFDYVLFEYINTECEYWGRVGNRDISEIIKVRGKLEVPVGLAHNDMQRNYNGREKHIAALLAKNNIFIELCQSEYSERRGAGRNTRDEKDYYQHFSRKLIDELLSSGVKVVAGTDSHRGEGLDILDGVYQFIEENHLRYHGMVL